MAGGSEYLSQNTHPFPAGHQDLHQRLALLHAPLVAPIRVSYVDVAALNAYVPPGSPSAGADIETEAGRAVARSGADGGSTPDPDKVRKLIDKFGGSESDVWAIGVGGYVRFDGNFVVVRHTGALGRGTVGKGEKRIPVRAITAIQLKPAGALVSGFIQFSLGGGDERRSVFGRQTFDAAGDENSMVFVRKDQGQFEALRDAVEAATVAPQAGQTAPTPDPLDQLRKLAELRDAGIISEDEFAATKADLMGRL